MLSQIRQIADFVKSATNFAEFIESATACWIYKIGKIFCRSYKIINILILDLN